MPGTASIVRWSARLAVLGAVSAAVFAPTQIAVAQEDTPARPAPFDYAVPPPPDPASLLGHGFGPEPRPDPGRSASRGTAPDVERQQPAPHTRPTAQTDGAAGIPVLPISFVSMNLTQTEIYFDGGDDTSSNVSMTFYYDGSSNLWYRFTDSGVSNLFPSFPCVSVSAITADCPGNVVAQVYINAYWGGSDPGDNVSILGTMDAVSIFGGTGNDMVTIGGGDLDFVAGAIYVDGGANSDHVTLDDDAVAYSDAYSINTSQVFRYLFGGLTVVNTEYMTLFAQQGHNTFNLSGSHPALSIFGQAGNDTFNVTDLDYLGPFTFLDGQADTDAVNVNDATSPYNDTHNVFFDLFYRDFSNGFNYAGMESFYLRAQDVAGDINVASSHAGTPVSIDAGGGSELVTIGPDLSYIDAPVTVNGGTDLDLDQLMVSDASGGGAAWTVLDFSAYHGAFAGVSWGGIDSIDIYGSGFGDDFGVYDTAAGQLATLHMGGGDDEAFVGAGDIDLLDGALSVAGDLGSDAVSVVDNATVYGDAYSLTYDSVTRIFFGGLFHSGLEQLTLDAQQGSNNIDVATTSYATPTMIHGNSGDDDVNIGSRLDYLDALITVDGGANFDELRINDSGAISNGTIRMIPGDISHQGKPMARYDATTEGVSVFASTYHDSVFIGGTLGGIATAAYGGVGDDGIGFATTGLAATGTLSLFGGPHAGGDSLWVYSDAGVYVDNGTQIIVPGKPPVSYAEFENKLSVPTPDTDGDGCTNVLETGPDANFGGRRDPLNYFDFYDVTGDRRIDLSDTLLVLEHFGHYFNDGLDTQLDREAPHPGQPWRTEFGSDGTGIDLSDALVSLDSFGHDCSPP